MSPHAFEPAHAGNCTCGKSLYHEEHFGGSRAAAAEAYQTDRSAEDQVPELLKVLTLGTRVRIRGTNPQYALRAGIVTYIEGGGPRSGFATIQIDDHPLPVNIPFRYLSIEPLVVPQFSSVEEAECWLEERNPIPRPKVPRFASKEEADDFLNRMQWARCARCKHKRHDHWQNSKVCQECTRAGFECTAFVEWDGSCQLCGDPTDHSGRACSLMPKGLKNLGDGRWQAERAMTYHAMGSHLPVTLAPGDVLTIKTIMTFEE